MNLLDTLYAHARSPREVVVQGCTFSIGRTLGKGSQGIVKLGTRTNGEQVALKFIEKACLSPRDLDLIIREVTAQRTLSEASEHISTLLACEDNVSYPHSDDDDDTNADEDNNSDGDDDRQRKKSLSRLCIVLVLELSSGGELLDQLMHGQGAFDEKLARSYFHQLLSALKACHSLGVAHRDVKLENIVLDGETFALRLCDFGLCGGGIQAESPSSPPSSPTAVAGVVDLCSIDSSTTTTEKSSSTTQLLCSTECGTVRYQAPEVLGNKSRRGGSQWYDGAKADLWSAGVVLFIMVVGYPPLERADSSDWYFNALAKKRYDRFWQAHNRTLPAHGSKPSEPFMDLVNQLLCVDSAQRLASVEDFLAHPWMSGVQSVPVPVPGGSNSESTNGAVNVKVTDSDAKYKENAVISPPPAVEAAATVVAPLLSGPELTRVMALRAKDVNAELEAKRKQEEELRCQQRKQRQQDQQQNKRQAGGAGGEVALR
jgi:serine/threonine protein kinase